MKTKRSKAAAIIAWIIGGMAVFAGGRVLLGTLPDYYVIDWLLIYNFMVGLVTVLVTAVLIWRNSRYALPAAIVTLPHSPHPSAVGIAHRISGCGGKGQSRCHGRAQRDLGDHSSANVWR